MHYQIGDVARTLGVTTAGLHYFEKEGVVTPAKGDTARRMYSTGDFIRLVSYKKYRNMEMPLKVIARQFSSEGDPYPIIEERVGRQVEEAQRLAEYYARLAEDTAWFRKHIAQGIERIDKIDFATMPSCFILSVGEMGCISSKKSEQILVSKWLEAMPATRVSVISGEDGTGKFGYSARVDRAERYNLTGAPAFLRGGKTCVHTFTRVSKELYDHPEMAFDTVRAYMHAHGFEEDGEAVGVVLCVHCHGEELDTLIEIYAPFK